MPRRVGRPPGSENKDKPFKDALRRALAQRDWKELDQIAHNLINAALEGDAFAIEQIANRLDGRPGQESESAVQGNPTVIVRYPWMEKASQEGASSEKLK
jgi:HPt (histidine-containing phosphotransfer) domain-containing protein